MRISSVTQLRDFLEGLGRGSTPPGQPQAVHARIARAFGLAEPPRPREPEPVTLIAWGEDAGCDVWFAVVPDVATLKRAL